MLRQITPPVIEPVSIQDVKTHTRISGSVQDNIISTWITTGRELAEQYQNRSYIEQTFEVTLDRFPCSPYVFPVSPLVSVESVKYFNTSNVEATMSSADYFVDTSCGRLSLGYSKNWPTVVLRPIAGVKIRFVAGYGKTPSYTPEAVKDAIYLYVTYRNENRSCEVDSIPSNFYNVLSSGKVF